MPRFVESKEKITIEIPLERIDIVLAALFDKQKELEAAKRTMFMSKELTDSWHSSAEYLRKLAGNIRFQSRRGQRASS